MQYPIASTFARRRILTRSYAVFFQTIVWISSSVVISSITLRSEHVRQTNAIKHHAPSKGTKIRCSELFLTIKSLMAQRACVIKVLLSCRRLVYKALCSSTSNSRIGRQHSKQRSRPILRSLTGWSRRTHMQRKKARPKQFSYRFLMWCLTMKSAA